MKGLTSRIPPRRTRADYLQKRTANIAIIGYARVSTPDQDFARQVEALKAAGATRIHREKVSGAGADPPQATLMMSLKRGDAVVVTKIDRLGRSTRELLELIHRISEVGVSFHGLGDPLFTTDPSQGKLLVTLLAAIAGFEGDLIRERAGDGAGRE
jgi:DNA invertase Pin-like site-specific DNA recombinase